MTSAKYVTIVSLLLAACAANRHAAGPTAPRGITSEASAPELLDAAVLLLEAGTSVRSETIAGTRGNRRWISIPAGDGGALQQVVDEMVPRLGAPTCAGDGFAQWDGRIRIEAYRAHALTTAVLIESPADPARTCEHR